MNSRGLSSTIYNPNLRGNLPSTCSGTPIIISVQKAESLRCLALRTRGGRLKSLVHVYVHTSNNFGGHISDGAHSIGQGML